MLLLTLALLIFGCNPLPKGDLEPGLPVEKEIVGGEVHSYRLPVAASSYISLRIEQPGIDIKARLEGPGGVSVPVFDDPCGIGGTDRLVAILDKAQEYQLKIWPGVATHSRGLYRVYLLERRKARPEDTSRLAAEREYAELRRLSCGPEVDLPRLLAWLQKTLRLWEKGGDLSGQVDTLVQIAELHTSQGRSRQAVEPSGRAAELARTARYPEGEARALQAKGNAYYGLSWWAKAIEEFSKALAIWRSVHDPASQGAVLYSLGLAHSNLNDFDQALASLKQARSLLINVGNAPLAVKALTAMGNIGLIQGATDQTLQTCGEALELGKSMADLTVQASASSCLGAVHRQRGELGLARELFQNSLEANLKIGNRPGEVYSRQALGSVYFNLGDPETTLVEYARALEISRAIERRDLEVRLLTNTGWIYQAQGDLRRALAFYRMALPLIEGSDKSSLALVQHNMGVAYCALQQPVQGLSFLRKALALRIESGERAAQATTLLEIGSAFQKLGESLPAVEYFQHSLDLAQKIKNASLAAECRFRRAVLESQTGELEKARATMSQSLEDIESLRSGVFSDRLKTSFFASKRAYYELYIEILARLEASRPGRFIEAALEASERARARGLLDLLAESNIDVRQGIPSALKQKDLELRARLSVLQEQLGRQAAGETEVARLERQFDDVQSKMGLLELQTREQFRRYADVRYPRPLRASEIRELLDDKTVLLQYFTGTRFSVLFVVTRKGLALHVLPGQQQLGRKIAALREVMQHRGRRQLSRYQALGSQLYEELLAPATSALEGRDHLLIAPDGPLHLLPFEALLTRPKQAQDRMFRDLPYLLRRYAISYTPSVSVLSGLRSQGPAPVDGRKARKRFIAFANPTYDGELGAGNGQPAEVMRSTLLAPLPDSETEVRRIAELFPRTAVVLYLGSAASEDNLKHSAWLSEARQIHFATHAVLDERHLGLSGLELTRARNSSEDGRLTIYEIFNLRLNADLVGLSACDTGLGREVSGEGVVGITRAFLYAGAKSLLVSLWQVSDRSTSDLMVNFYRHFGISVDKAAALRQAKLALIESRRFSEPYYWAPFVLSGDPR